MNYSDLTDKELEALWHEYFLQEEALVKEYRATHKIPSRGIISTPEIDDLRKKQVDLLREYLKRHSKKLTEKVKK